LPLPEFEVRATAPAAVGLDGEALMLAPPLRFVSLLGALRVHVPRNAAGVSPAGSAVTLTRRNIWALVHISAGRPVQPPLRGDRSSCGRLGLRTSAFPVPMTRLARMPETLEPLAGIAVHIGASVAANAQPGEGLVSSTVRGLSPGPG
jgi:hypothetical protein